MDVSIDGGKHFTRADLLPSPIQQRRGSNWSWIFFEKKILLPEDIIQKLQNGEKVCFFFEGRGECVCVWGGGGGGGKFFFWVLF